MARKTHVIYLITINGTPYVGQTANFRNRRRDHIADLKRNNHDNPGLQKAYNKHGAEAFKITILEYCSPKDANKLECEWIAIYNSYRKGFNCTTGGDGGLQKPCIWNGIKYSSVTAAAKANNRGVPCMSLRLKRGYTCDADLQTMIAEKPVTYNGIEYPSVKAAAMANNIPRGVMSWRILNGATSDRDAPKKEIAVEIDSVQYESIRAAARQLGIGKSTIRRWIAKGKAIAIGR